jgi:hypothetical protein
LLVAREVLTGEVKYFLAWPFWPIRRASCGKTNSWWTACQIRRAVEAQLDPTRKRPEITRRSGAQELAFHLVQSFQFVAVRLDELVRNEVFRLTAITTPNASTTENVATSAAGKRSRKRVPAAFSPYRRNTTRRDSTDEPSWSL